MKFIALLPPDVQSPVKATKDGTPALRRYRIWLDAYLKPGQADELLNHGGNFSVDIGPETE